MALNGNSDGMLLKESCPSPVFKDMSHSVDSTGLFFIGMCNCSALSALALPMIHAYSLVESSF